MASLSTEEQEGLAYEDSTPTPSGWRRKLILHIGKGLIPARTDVVFVAPSGEEFKNKAKLQRFLKANKGSPSLSEFIWDTDETPRRSSRSASKLSRSPPKTIRKNKSARGVPREEAKATKRSDPDKEAAWSGNKRRRSDKAIKVTPTKSQEKSNGTVSSGQGSEDAKSGRSHVSALSKAKEGEVKPNTDNKKRKGVTAETKSDEVSKNIAEVIADVQNSKDNGKEQMLEMNGKEDSSTEGDGKEDSLDQLLSPGEKEADSENLQTVVQDEKQSKDFHAENGVPMDADNDDRTTTSLLGSDLSAEGMEGDSDIFESEENRALPEEEGDTVQQGERASASDS